jgi:DNA gyrase subunit A
VVSFPVVDSDQMVMVSDGGQLIRCPVKDISIVGRSARGVTLFRVAEGEKVVSVSRIRDVEGGDEEDAPDEGDAPAGEETAS